MVARKTLGGRTPFILVFVTNATITPPNNTAMATDIVQMTTNIFTFIADDLFTKQNPMNRMMNHMNPNQKNPKMLLDNYMMNPKRSQMRNRKTPMSHLHLGHHSHQR